MKYKSIYDIQESRRSGASFDISYFNGRYIGVGNTEMLHNLMQLNEKVGYPFNCVFSLQLDERKQKMVTEAIDRVQDSDEALCSLADSLPLEGYIVLRLNPQMAFLLSQRLSFDCGLIFQFELNWKGAEILRDMCLKTEQKELYVLGHRLQDLIDVLQARRADWENHNPKGVY